MADGEAGAVAWPRMPSRPLALALSLSWTFACDASRPAPAHKGDDPPVTPAKAEPKAAKAEDPHESPKLTAPPEGTVAIGRVYVQTCAAPTAGSGAETGAPAPCPALLQDAGVAHCKALALGGLLWRLPTLEELESWRGHPGLVGFDVFHWSGTTWDEDPAQIWIYDPGSGAKTTAKPDRKPFTIRCVA